MAYAFFHHMPSPTHTAYPFFVKRETVKREKNRESVKREVVKSERRNRAVRQQEIPLIPPLKKED